MPSAHDDLAESIVRGLRATTRADWSTPCRLGGGHQSGAWLLHAHGRSPVVLKLAHDAAWSAQVLRAEQAVEAARRQGYPAAPWLATGTASGLAYHLEEFLPGAHIETVDRDHAVALVALVESQAGLDPDPGRCWTDLVLGTPVEGRAGASGVHERRLLDLCRTLSEGRDAAQWPRNDLVHGDLRPANILFRGLTIEGVVDVEALGSGPRAFDYATLLSHEHLDPDAVELLARAGAESADPRVLRACVAHVFLDLVRFVADLPDADRGDVENTAAYLADRAAVIERLVAPSKRAPAP